MQALNDHYVAQAIASGRIPKRKNMTQPTTEPTFSLLLAETERERLAVFVRLLDPDHPNGVPGGFDGMSHAKILPIVRRTLGRRLRKSAEDEGISLRHLARNCQAPRENVRDILSGDVWPPKNLFGRMAACIPFLRAIQTRLVQAERDLEALRAVEEGREAPPQPQASQEPAPAPEPPPAPPDPVAPPTTVAPTGPTSPQGPAPQPAAPPPAKVLKLPVPPGYKPPERMPFHVALWHARNGEGLSTTDLAQMVGVTRGAVEAWEANEYVPITAHYRALTDLFPSLLNAIAPSTRDIPKPVGRLAQADEKEPMPPTSTPSASPATDPISTLLLLKRVKSSGDGASFLGLLKASEASGKAPGELVAAVEALVQLAKACDLSADELVSMAARVTHSPDARAFGDMLTLIESSKHTTGDLLLLLDMMK